MVDKDKLFEVLSLGLRSGRLTARCSSCKGKLHMPHITAQVCPYCGPFEQTGSETVLFATESN
jgi:hypothetical protein